MVELNTVISGLLTVIVYTVFSVAFAASLLEPDEDYYNIRANVLNHSPEETLGTVIRHGRSRNFFSLFNRRSGSEPKFLNKFPFGSYNIPNNNENKNSIMKSPPIDHEGTVTDNYESSTVADVLQELGLSLSSLDITVPIKPTTKETTAQTSSQIMTASLQITTSRTDSEILQTTTVSDQMEQQQSESSVKKFPEMLASDFNASDWGRHFENKLRSTADVTSPRRKAHSDGEGFTVSNPKDESESLSYVDGGFDFAVEGTDTDIGADGVGRVTDAVDARRGSADVVTRFLTIVESQHLLGENCTAGTDLNLGEGVVDQYAQERFRVEADVAVNRANMLTRLWKYADAEVMRSEYLLHASVFSMVEFDEDIFAAGNCYDQFQYKDYVLFCPYAYRLPEGQILVKDLAVEYKYLSNTSEWFYIARKHAENVIRNYSQFSHGYHTYTHNESAHTERVPDEILSVRYEDGKWSKPYYDCGGGNIWMLTYTVPFFGFQNDTYFFMGTSGIDIDLRRVDIDQCPLPAGSTQLNIFAASDKCKKRTTQCVPIPGLGFRRGSYKCVCRRGFYFPDVRAIHRYYNGTVLEEEYEKLLMEVDNQYSEPGMFECLQCAEGCESCMDDRPCVVSLNWVMRTAILILSCVIICCLPVVVLFTWKYGNVKVVRAASPVLLRVITLGAFFIYCTMIVMYPRPNIYTCTVRVWLREIGFSLTYGALMLKTWRISVIFRVRSAKAVKITDLDLLKRLGVIVTIFSVFLVIRTLVAPPHVIVGRTADDLKAFLCRTDWWDHSFTTLEVMFLVWGIRLCIVVRKAPSEFNESRFISMAIYNEFLLSVFLNVSMLFLQKPANPDLLYIIFFCHTQLTVTLLLCLIFGSKAYMVFKGHGKSEESSSAIPKPQAAKFLAKPRSGNSQCAPSTNSSTAGVQEYAKLNEMDVQEEFQRLYTQLEQLKEKNMRLGNRHLAAKITAMQEAAKQNYNEGLLEAETPSGNTTADHLKLNNVLAVVTDKIVCATVASDDLSVRSIPLDATNHTRSPPKSKCSSLVSSPDSETPLQERLPITHRISVANLNMPVNDSGGPTSETGGRTYSRDSSVTPTSERQVRKNKGKDGEDVSEAGVRRVDLEMASTCKKGSSGDGSSGSRSKKRGNVGKSRNSSGGGAGGGSGSNSGGGKKRTKSSGEGDVDKRKECNRYVEKAEPTDDSRADVSSGKAAHSQSSSEGASPNNTGSNNRNLKSGHARTHAIVINLDDKNRFTEEVTV